LLSIPLNKTQKYKVMVGVKSGSQSPSYDCIRKLANVNWLVTPGKCWVIKINKMEPLPGEAHSLVKETGK
jgi:hypothetical protein